MSMMYGGSSFNPGVIVLRSTDADSKRDIAGRKAVQEQQPGDEFVIVIPEDLQDCLDRLDEVRTEMGELTSKMYAVANHGANAAVGYIGPPAAVRLAIKYDMDCLEQEEALLMARVYELSYVAPPEDENEDAAEDEQDKGDPTQPGNYVAGPARNAVDKAIGWPDKNVKKMPSGGSATPAPPETWGR